MYDEKPKKKKRDAQSLSKIVLLGQVFRMLALFMLMSCGVSIVSIVIVRLFVASQ